MSPRKHCLFGRLTYGVHIKQKQIYNAMRLRVLNATELDIRMYGMDGDKLLQ